MVYGRVRYARRMTHPTPGLCNCGCGGKTTLAPRTDRRLGWVRGQSMPYLHNHRPRAWTWTEADDEALRTLYGTMSAFAVGKKLGRSEGSVRNRAAMLGLVNQANVHSRWSDAELTDLRKRYSVESAKVIGERLGRSSTAVIQQARVLGLDSNKTLVTQSVASDYFRLIDTVEKAYVLGLLAADGNVGDDAGISFGLQAKDEHLVRFVQSRLAPAHALTRNTNRGFASFTFVSHSMASDLAGWGVIPRKSRVLPWPTALGEFQRPYLLGYFDGDGSACLSRHGPRVYPNWSVCSGSAEFLTGLKSYVRSELGVELDKIQHRPKSSLSQVAIVGAGACIVDHWLHQDGLGLSRKRFPDAVVDRYRNKVADGRNAYDFASWVKQFE